MFRGGDGKGKPGYWGCRECLPSRSPGLAVGGFQEFVHQSGAGDYDAGGEESAGAALSVNDLCSCFLGQYQTAGDVPGRQGMVEVKVDTTGRGIG